MRRRRGPATGRKRKGRSEQPWSGRRDCDFCSATFGKVASSAFASEQPWSGRRDCDVEKLRGAEPHPFVDYESEQPWSGRSDCDCDATDGGHPQRRRRNSPGQDGGIATGSPRHRKRRPTVRVGTALVRTEGLRRGKKKDHLEPRRKRQRRNSPGQDGGIATLVRPKQGPTSTTRQLRRNSPGQDGGIATLHGDHRETKCYERVGAALVRTEGLRPSSERPRNSSVIPWVGAALVRTEGLRPWRRSLRSPGNGTTERSE